MSNIKFFLTALYLPDNFFIEKYYMRGKEKNFYKKDFYCLKIGIKLQKINLSENQKKAIKNSKYSFHCDENGFYIKEKKDSFFDNIYSKKSQYIIKNKKKELYKFLVDQFIEDKLQKNVLKKKCNFMFEEKSNLFFKHKNKILKQIKIISYYLFI